jgi:O-antigen ligase
VAETSAWCEVIANFLQPHQAKFSRAADGFAMALATSLPWSVSATGIFVGLWVLAVLPTLDGAVLRDTFRKPAAAVVVGFVALAALGMLWSEATWPRAFQGLTQFLKLLVIPLLFIHFSRSERGLWVFGAFLLSCSVLLLASFALIAFPRPFGWRLNTHGIPVRDRIVQSGEFVLCALGTLYVGVDYFRAGRRLLAMALAVLAAAFLANVLYIAASRTALLVIPVLLLLWSIRLFGWKGTAIVAVAGIVLGGVIWMSSSHLRERITGIVQEIQGYEDSGEATSSGQRLSYWTKAVGFIKQAPVIGHGTGTIRQLFEQASIGQGKEWQTANPHNQTLAIGIQLGAVGIAVLFALWLTHFLLFVGQPGLMAWIGLMVVVQNIVSSLFNSHLFDFSQGWTYVLGVGVAGGAMLRAGRRSGADSQRPV